MSEDIKRMDIKKFRECGYLQELNRQFLHPLGLALEVNIDKDGVETLGGVWDSQDDPDGFIFHEDHVKIEEFKEKTSFIKNLQEQKRKIRKESLGYNIQPVDL